MYYSRDNCNIFSNDWMFLLKALIKKYSTHFELNTDLNFKDDEILTKQITIGNKDD